MRLRKALAFCVAGAILVAPAIPAQAASFAPTATFKLSSTALKANPTLTITVSQKKGEEEIAKVQLFIPHGFSIPPDSAINNGEKVGSGTIKVALQPTCDPATEQQNPVDITEKDRSAKQKNGGVFSVWHVNIQNVVTFDLVWRGSVANGFVGTASIPTTPGTCPPFTFKATVNKTSSGTHHKILINPATKGTYTFKAIFTSRPSGTKVTRKQAVTIG